MPETFAWPDGTLSIWTGAASPSTSAVIAYARDTQASLTWGYDNRVNASGVYLNHLTGYRADINFNAVQTIDTTLAKMAQSATAVHLKLIQNNIVGSAGYFFYSGRIATIVYRGSEKNPFMYQLTVFANAWSAF